MDFKNPSGAGVTVISVEIVNDWSGSLDPGEHKTADIQGLPTNVPAGTTEPTPPFTPNRDCPATTVKYTYSQGGQQWCRTATLSNHDDEYYIKDAHIEFGDTPEQNVVTFDVDGVTPQIQTGTC